MNRLPLALSFFVTLIVDFTLRLFQFFAIDAISIIFVNYFLRRGYWKLLFLVLSVQVVLYFFVTYIKLFLNIWKNRN